MLLLIDALSFLISAISLMLITTSFNIATDEKQTPKSLRQDIVEGLLYVLKHPILSWITLLFLTGQFHFTYCERTTCALRQTKFCSQRCTGRVAVYMWRSWDSALLISGRAIPQALVIRDVCSWSSYDGGGIHGSDSCNALVLASAFVMGIA